MASDFSLSDYDVSEEWGFLNGDAAQTSLPSIYNNLIQLAAQMGELLRHEKLRSALSEAEPIAVPPDLTLSQQRLLFAVYGMLASGHVFAIHQTHEAVVLPASVAKPLYQLSQQLGMPPILNYDGYICNNFRYVQSAALESEPESYKPLFTFSSPSDDEYESERWFIAGHVGAERRIGPLAAKLGKMQAIVKATNGSALAEDDEEILREFLDHLFEAILDMSRIVTRTRQRLDSESYALTTRKYVQPFKGVIFQGVADLNGQPQQLAGESGGQSPSLRAVGAFLGISHQLDAMALLGKHMLPSHRRYIEFLDSGPSLRSRLSDFPNLTRHYNRVVEALINFRISHLSTAATYLSDYEVSTGTGQMAFQTYLGHVLAETIIARVPSRPADAEESSSSSSSEENLISRLRLSFLGSKDDVRARSGSAGSKE